MAPRDQHCRAVTLVTGGASGIGRALAEACARRGELVVLADRQRELAGSVAEQIRERGGRASAVPLDVRDGEAFETTVADVEDRFGPIALFFNNAGIAIAGEVAQYRRADWDDLLDVNLRGVVYGIQSVYPRMVARGRGHIVSTASMAGFIPMPGGVAYGTSKHAVVGMTKSLRIEAALHGVRVSALCPGVIRTPILEGGEYGRVPGSRLDRATLMQFWERLRPMDPDRFARQVLADVAANEPFIVVPRWWKALWLLERLAPRLGLRIGEKVHASNRGLVRAIQPEPQPQDAPGRDEPARSSQADPGP